MIDIICSPRIWRCCVVAVAILALLPAVGSAQEQQSPASVQEALHAALIDRHSSSFVDGAPDPLFEFYASRNFTPAWTVSRVNRNLAETVLFTLSHADTQGLQFQDYSDTENRWRAPPESGPEAAAFELSLTVDLMHYAADVRLGKLNPAQVYGDVELPVRTFEFVAALNDALRTGRIKQFLADLPPQQPEYRGLIGALASYRLQQSYGGWAKVTGSAEVPLDGSNQGSQALILRLSQEDFQLAANPKLSIDDVRDGLMRFQARNGIRADGRAGAMTLAALTFPSTRELLRSSPIWNGGGGCNGSSRIVMFWSTCPINQRNSSRMARLCWNLVLSSAG